MKIRQEALDHVLKTLPDQFLSELITKKLAEQGAILSKRQRKRLVKGVRQGRDTFVVDAWSWWDRAQATIELKEDEIEQIGRKFANFLEVRLPGLINEVADDLSRSILAHLKRTWRAESRQQRSELAGFRKRLYGRWKPPLEALRMLLTISRENGSSINEELSRSKDSSKRKHLIDVLLRSHARGCQITEEIICLLEGGFADGAIARWRTLHEVAVVSSFVATHGEDLAERFVLHDAVESKKAASDYQRCQRRLGYEPLEERELGAVQSSYDAVIQQFGPNYGKGSYGWAAYHLGKATPTFWDIEREAGIDHLRAHYRMASHNVHANPKGVFFKLGLLDESQAMLAGPSDIGLGDPGHCTALSLALISAQLFLLQPTLDNGVVLRIIVQLRDEIGEAFLQAHEAQRGDRS